MQIAIAALPESLAQQFLLMLEGVAVRLGTASVQALLQDLGPGLDVKGEGDCRREPEPLPELLLDFRERAHAHSIAYPRISNGATTPI